MMDWRPLETSQVLKRSPMRVNTATPCVLCPVRTCPQAKLRIRPQSSTHSDHACENTIALSYVRAC